MLYKDIVRASNLIKGLKIDFDKTFARRRFLKLFKNDLECIVEIQDDIREKYSKKNEDGSMKVAITGVGQNQMKEILYTPENKKKANDEFKALDLKEVDIDFSKNMQDVKVCIEIYEEEIENVKKLAEGKFTDLEGEYIESLLDVVSILKEAIKEQTKAKK